MIIDPEIGLPPPSTVPEIDFPTGVGVAVGVGVILAMAELLGVGVAVGVRVIVREGVVVDVGVAVVVGVGVIKEVGVAPDVGVAPVDDVGVRVGERAGVPLLTKCAMPSPLPPQPEIPIIRQTAINSNVENFEKTAITIPLNKRARRLRSLTFADCAQEKL